MKSTLLISPDSVAVTILAVLGIVVIFLFLSLPFMTDSATFGYAARKIQYYGHQYIVFERGSMSGIVHDPDCHCQE